jgi:hypothetical protein
LSHEEGAPHSSQLSWTAQGWDTLWAVYSRQTRPYTQKPPTERSGRPPPNGVYIVQKV